MINLLRLTSFLAVIAAGLLIYYFVIPMVVGTEGDERVEDILNSPTVVEKFRKSEGPKMSKAEVSPLVTQAKLFANYLNPQKIVNPPVTGQQGYNPPPIKRTTTPKFRVFATAFFEGNPQLSQALIDLPGGERRWVMQSGTVSGLTLEQVKDGMIIVTNDKESFELEVESNPQAPPLNKAIPTTSKAITGRSTLNKYTPTYSRPVSGVSRITDRSSINNKTTAGQTPTKTASSQQRIDEAKNKNFINLLREEQVGKTSAEKQRIEELISKFQTKINGSGEKSLKDSGSKDANNAGDPNRTSSATKGGKIVTGSVKTDPKIKK